MSTQDRVLPGRPVLSEASRRRIAELVAAAPPLSAHQRAVISAAYRAHRHDRAAAERLGRAS